MTSHAVALQDGGALASKAITKHPFFLKWLHYHVVIYFLTKVEITLVNNVT